MLNSYTADDDVNSPYKWVRACYYCRIVGVYLLFALPLFFFIPFYLMKRDEWSTETFKKVYGTFLEGTRVDLRENEIKGNWIMLL